MTKQTLINYTTEQTQDVVTSYQTGEAVEAIASRLGKSVNSVVAKLSREGVYKPKTKARGEQPVRKAELISQIAAAINTNEELIESLEKATKEALELIAKAVRA